MVWNFSVVLLCVLWYFNRLSNIKHKTFINAPYEQAKIDFIATSLCVIPAGILDGWTQIISH